MAMKLEVWHGKCQDRIAEARAAILGMGLQPVIVTDPPFNVGYKYRTYKDKMPEAEYYEMLAKLIDGMPAVVIHYPEALHRLSIELGKAPERVIEWVYNEHTKRQHRSIAFYGIEPDMTKIRQPYKNPTDKRVEKLINEGYEGAAIYDWWNIPTVKNVSKEKTEHPCQMPTEVMNRIVKILGDGYGVIDPFCGSGTTGVACRDNDVPFIGIEMDEKYCQIARERIANEERSEAGKTYYKQISLFEAI
jgi:site-specific DNA-methyltransferase (adenine-specific)